MKKDKIILPLLGAVQHYAWGGYRFIPELLGIDNSRREPYAELWMGAHPRGPARLGFNGPTETLDKFIDRDPPAVLGERVAGRFDNRLPFLFKVLDVRKMLSIQAHPTKEQAKAGFRRENEQGIPLEADDRVFKDDNHKPEVMVALTDFWLLHGFRTPEAIRQELNRVPELRTLLEYFSGEDIAGLYRFLMEMPQEQVNERLAPLARRLVTARAGGSLTKELPEYWAAEGFADYTTEAGDYDRGIFSIFLLNLVRLRPGEAIFQDAGIPHAYLEGVNVELMANSDNVFRGGLTPKHIDVPALMAHLVFKPVTPRILKGETVSATERRYPTPAPDFEISQIQLDAEHEHRQRPVAAPQIFLVLEGRVTADGDRRFGRGESFLLPAGTPLSLRSDDPAVLYRAGVPDEEVKRDESRG